MPAPTINRQVIDDARKREHAQRNGGDAAAPTARDVIDAATQLPALRIVAGAELHARTFEPRQFIIDGLMARGDFLVLAGRPKSGKSWLLLQAAAAIDTGAAFLGRSTTRAKVFYLALEDGDQRVYERLHLTKWKPAGAGFAFGCMPCDDGGLDQVKRAAEAYDVVIIDTLRAFVGGLIDENDNARMGQLCQRIADWAHVSKKAVMLTHHTSKNHEGDDAFDAIRGAGAIRGAYDVGVVLRRKPGEAEAVLHVESRNVEVPDMTIAWGGTDKGWTYEGDGRELTRRRTGRELVSAFEQLGDGQTVEALAKHLSKATNTIREQLTKGEGTLYRRMPQQQTFGKKVAELWERR